LEALRELGFASAPELQDIKNSNVLAERKKAEKDVDEQLQNIKDPINDFDYLLNMPLSSLTTDKIMDLKKEAENTETELSDIQKLTPEDLWHADLDKLEPHLTKIA
jgi:DNA topoisomerase-2